MLAEEEHTNSKGTRGWMVSEDGYMYGQGKGQGRRERAERQTASDKTLGCDPGPGF